MSPTRLDAAPLGNSFSMSRRGTSLWSTSIIQAAAFCYAYKKIERLNGIDAFILHRHVDSAQEGGLLLGLRSNQPKDGDSQPKKKIYDCFRAADTPEWEKAFEFALPVIGLRSWDGDR